MDISLEDLDKLIDTIDSTPSKSFKEREKKKNDFKEYLYRSGVYESLSNALKLLYEQPTKPINPLDFICSNIGQPRACKAEYKKMSDELQAKNKKIKNLEEELLRYRKSQLTIDEEKETTASKNSAYQT